MPEQENGPEGFTPFKWGLAGLCFPILLWPLALLLSPSLLANPSLSHNQALSFAGYFWFYPFMLAIAARLLYKLHKNSPRLAIRLLAVVALIFWCVLIYIVIRGLT